MALPSNYVILDQEPKFAEHIWLVDMVDENGEIIETVGPFLITFDKEHVLNVWSDYPKNFTEEQIKIFQKECPYWADFFADRIPNKFN